MSAINQHSINRNTTTNDVTGDKIQSKGVLSEQGRKNWDNITWGVKASKKVEKADTLIQAAALSLMSDKPNFMDRLRGFDVGIKSMGTQIFPIIALKATCDCQGKAHVRMKSLICSECKKPYVKR